MTEEDVVEIVHTYIKETLFPKRCTNCGMIFTTFREYLEKTTAVGLPISYDADFDEWEPKQPLGTMSLSNCSCGSTLALSSEKMSKKTLLRLMVWTRIESIKRGVTFSELLATIRKSIDTREFTQ